MILLKHRVFNDYTFMRMCTPGDGSCFFHAVARAINYENCNVTKRHEGRRLRNALLTHKRWQAFLDARGEAFAKLAPSFESVRNPMFFAGDYLINFTAEALGLNIVTLQSMKEMYSTHPLEHHATATTTATVPVPVILIAWIHRNHFEPIMEDCGDDKTAVLSRAEEFCWQSSSSSSSSSKNRNTAESKLQGCFSVHHPIVQRLHRIMLENRAST